MSGGSQQLRRFRIAVRDGASVEDAAEAADMSIAEARIHAAADAKNPPPPEAYVLLRAINPEAAGCAVTTQGDLIMPDQNDDAPLVEMASDTLRGDVRDALLAWVKQTPKSWSQMAEREQRDLAGRADVFARAILKQACQIIAANERPCIVASLVEYKEKEGVEAKLKLASTGANVAALHEACGREVLIVTSGYDDVSGEAAEAEIDADQPGIPGIGDEYDEAA